MQIIIQGLWTLILGWYGFSAAQICYNLFLHPLQAFPGPRAARATAWWKTYIEVVKQESMVDILLELHKKYGEIVRVSPNEVSTNIILLQKTQTVDECSYTLPTLQRIIKYTILLLDGTKKRHSTNHLGKITLHLDFGSMQRRRNGRTFYNPCSLEDPSLEFKNLSRTM